MEIVSYATAKKLKEKGFSCELPFAMYNENARLHLLSTAAPYNVCASGYKYREYYDYDDFDEYDYIAPTISQVLKWLREEHHIHFEVVGAGYGYNLIISDTPDKGSTDRYYTHANDDGPNDGGAWDSYEECVLYGIEYTLDNLI